MKAFLPFRFHIRVQPMSESRCPREAADKDSLNTDPSLPMLNRSLPQTLPLQHHAGKKRKAFMQRLKLFTCHFSQLLKALRMRDTPYSLRNLPDRQDRAQKRKTALSNVALEGCPTRKKPSRLELSGPKIGTGDSIRTSQANSSTSGDRTVTTHPFFKLPPELQDKVNSWPSLRLMYTVLR